MKYAAMDGILSDETVTKMEPEESKTSLF